MQTMMSCTRMRLLATCFWLAPAVLHAQAEASPPLTLEVGAWAPYIDFTSPNKGALTRQVQDAFSTAGIATKLKEVSWKGAEDRVNRTDAVSFGWIKNSDRLTRWQYSNPICSLRTVLVTRASYPVVWQNLEQLKGYKLGWSRGYSYGDALDRLRPILDVIEMASEDIALNRLRNGSVDAVPMDVLVARSLMSKIFTPEEAQSLVVDAAPNRTIFKSDVHVVCAQASASCAATLERFNQGLRAKRGNAPSGACTAN
jgi:polar amino acid transport system substrate-binding protein